MAVRFHDAALAVLGLRSRVRRPFNGTAVVQADCAQRFVDLLRKGTAAVSSVDHTELSDVLWAAKFFGANDLLDALLRHVTVTAATIASRPPLNPYNFMFGVGDDFLMIDRFRVLIQDVRDHDPALAERIIRNICGGDGVEWSYPGGAFLTATGNSHLKCAAAAVAGGALTVSANGTPESVDGVAIEALHIQHDISKLRGAKFNVPGSPVMIGTIDSISHFDCVVYPEEKMMPGAGINTIEDIFRAISGDEFGFPKVTTVNVKVSCTLTPEPSLVSLNISFLLRGFRKTRSCTVHYSIAS